MTRFNDFKIWLSETFKEVFFKTYPVDGYDPSTDIIIYSEGITGHGLPPFSARIIILTFLGFPTRVPYNGQLTIMQLIFNFFGGRPSLKDGTFFQTLISFIIILCKLMIPLIKLITLPIKFLINCIKVVTEFLPMFMSQSFNKIQRLSSTKVAQIIVKIRNRTATFGEGLSLVPLILISLISSTLASIIEMLHLMGRSITSPLTNARFAFKVGRKLETHPDSLTRPFSYIVGFIFALSSIALTAIFWFCFLPPFVSGLISYIPAFGQALTWISQLSSVHSALMYIQTATTQIPFIATFVSSLANGLAITYTSALLYLAAPVTAVIGTCFSFVADTFSNWWVTSFRKKHTSFSLQPLVLEDPTIDNMASSPDEILDRLSEQLYGYVGPWLASNPSEVHTLSIEVGNRELTIPIDPQHPLDQNQIREALQRLFTESANSNASLAHSQRVLNLLQRRTESEYDAEAAVFLAGHRASLAQPNAQRTLSSFQPPVLPYEATPPIEGADTHTLKEQSYPPYCLPSGAPQYQAPPPTQRTENGSPTPYNFEEPSPFQYQSYNNSGT